VFLSSGIQILTVTTVFTIRSRRVTKLQLGVDNVGDLLVLNLGKLGIGDLAGLMGNLDIQKLLGAEERTQVLRAEGGSLVKLGGHGEMNCRIISFSRNAGVQSTHDQKALSNEKKRGKRKKSQARSRSLKEGHGTTSS